MATVRLINNFNRSAHVEVALSGSKKTFPVLLHEFGQFFGLRDCTIWTSRLPCKKILSLSQLYSELDKNPQFLVCGSEDMPTEMAGLSHSSIDHHPSKTPGRSQTKILGKKKTPGPEPMHGIKTYSPYDEDRIARRQLQGDTSPSIVFSPQGAPSRDVSPTKVNHIATKSRKGHHKKSKPEARFSDDDLLMNSNNGTSEGISTMNEKPMSPIRGGRGFETLKRKNRLPKTGKAKPEPEEGKIKRRVGLHLEWVYGYRGKDARENLFHLPTGELLYYVGTVAVVYDPDGEVQKHFKGHTEDINW